MQSFSNLVGATLLTVVLLLVQPILMAQERITRCDPPAGSLSRLTRAQKDAFFKSQDKFLAGRFADALDDLRTLLKQLPQESVAHAALAERAAEAAIFAEDRPYAISLLQPLVERDGNDCTARTLLARAYAEGGQAAKRDAELSALTALHQRFPKSPAGKLDSFLLEEHRLGGDKTVRVWYCLRPLEPHKVHIYAMVSDSSASPIVIIELDSDDGDQIDFKATHPDLAAKGDRRFTLDAWKPDRSRPDGLIHLPVIAFFEGRPAYDVVRGQMLKVAEAVAKDPAILD
jgi:hypothetical protein